MNKRLWFFRLFSLAAVLAGLLLFSGASAEVDQPEDPPVTTVTDDSVKDDGVTDDGVTDDEVNAIAKELYCPVCPNTPLDVCETQACKDWRAQIKDQLSQGWSKEQIVAYFVSQYGERVLGEPQRRGFTSMVWFLPLIGVGLGAGVVVVILKNWRTSAPAGGAVQPTPQPEIPEAVRQEIEQEIRRLD